MTGPGSRRGGPGDYDGRLARVERLLAAPGGGGGAAGPLNLLAAVLRYQAGRAAVPAVAAAAAAGATGAELRLAAGRFPLLDLGAAVGSIASEIPVAVAGLTAVLVPEPLVPEPLLAAGGALAGGDDADREGLVAAWLEDLAGPEAVLSFWVRVAAAPILEAARAKVATPGREEWAGSACPACGGLAQLSVIAPDTGEFMGGSPRSLVCGRCAGHWTYPRALCTWCSEGDPRRLPSFVRDERPAVRIDGCETCGSYVKTFDLREAGGVDLVPLVDDVATVALDLWAHDQGLVRPLVSFAGV